MAQPAWDDPELKAGVMIKGALWLLQCVGVGNVFTKSDIRQAFPGIAQADRRIRDLRDFGWVLYTRAEDGSLLQEETRFVRAGTEVWDPRARREGNPKKGISAKERMAIFARDGYACTICGVSGGEEYPDDRANSAVLLIAKHAFVTPGGDQERLATVCKRCNSGAPSRRGSASQVLDAARRLDSEELAELVRWIRQRRRDGSPVDFAWSSYLNLSPEDREQVRADLMS